MDSHRFPDITLFCNITLFGNDGVNSIKYKSKSLPLHTQLFTMRLILPSFANFIQALHA